MIKLIAIDMDGTLLDDHKTLPVENIRIIQEAVAKGVKIVLCTGRTKSGVLPYFKELKLGNQEGYAIMDNGCTTYRTKDWSLLDYQALSSAEIEYLANLATDGNGIDLTFFDQSHYYVLGKQIPELVAYDASLVFTTPTPISLQRLVCQKSPIFQAMFVGEPHFLDTFQKKWQGMLSQHFSMVRSQSVLYEAMPKGITKASALASLAEHLGLKPDNIMAIGDAANDKEMLKYAGLSVAMGNASQDIKDIADDVTADHNQAGVARAIETWVL